MLYTFFCNLNTHNLVLSVPPSVSADGFFEKKCSTMQVMQTIDFKSAIKIINRGEKFSFQCVTYDKDRKRGGDIFTALEAVVCSSKTNTKTSSPNKPIKPNHIQHLTKNVELLVDGVKTGQVRKIHLPLLISINGKKVVI